MNSPGPNGVPVVPSNVEMLRKPIAELRELVRLESETARRDAVDRWIHSWLVRASAGVRRPALCPEPEWMGMKAVLLQGLMQQVAQLSVLEKEENAIDPTVSFTAYALRSVPLERP